MSSMGGGEVGTPRGLARSSSGVWWKLGDAAAASDASSEVERRLRGIAEEEAAVRARVERRHAAAPAVRRRIAAASMGLEAVALVYGLWTAARRRGNSSRRLKLLHLLPALAVPAMATLVLAAFARFRRTLDGRDQQHLERLRTERKAKIGSFRGSHHNLQKLIEYDPDDAADSSNNSSDAAATKKKLKRTHSRLSFHVGDE
ncbi:hypothetical protein SEVIR_1G384500v4 [Setaria viridis]|uniref:uncharacterized protein At2g24330 isoform X2 n=1 Tax=Setaria italica TaxID=4555 RepID=UPI0003512E52|nr:uncharacterized protein At2g24330 isoform X2 [Setaria italica]XP_034578052.1 uncharacterized protein At2g24330-like isoform X2 [Setaria viridis]